MTEETKNENKGPILEIKINGLNGKADIFGSLYAWLETGNIETDITKENISILRIVKKIVDKVNLDLDELEKIQSEHKEDEKTEK